jgi:hypothetical protein
MRKPGIHLGGDEVSYVCWGQDRTVNPGCRGGPPNETYSGLEQRFYAELHDMLATLGKRPMHWHGGWVVLSQPT